MARGFIGGAISGGLVSLGVAVVASVMAPPAQSPRISITAPDATLAPQASIDAVERPATVTDATPQIGEAAPTTVRPEADSVARIDEDALRVPRVPAPAVVDDLAPPASGADAGAVQVEREDPVLPNPQALAPMMPQGADDITITTRPAAPPQVPEVSAAPPLVVAEATPDLPEAEVTSETPPSSAPVPEAPIVSADLDSPVAEGSPDTVTRNSTDDGVRTPDPVREDPAPDASAEAAPPEDETVIAQAPQEDTPVAPAMQAPASRPQIGTPAGALTDRQTDVVIRRLGTPVGQTQEEATETEVTVITEEGATDPNADIRPIAVYAQPFDNPEGKPLMSIVLIDDGSNPTAGAAGIAALRSFPYTLSFAVDSSLPDAAERMALYRAEGFEVMALIDLPSGARATDVETTLGVVLSQMREVVGVLEGPATGLQGSRAVADQVTAILAQSGHGLVTQDKGLNTMPNLARKEGVPAAAIFRDFDSKDQTATVIRRFLDQAAFKAGQEGAVIMLGRLRPDTISALLLWGLQDRAGRVALSPISSVLTREDG